MKRAVFGYDDKPTIIPAIIAAVNYSEYDSIAHEIYAYSGSEKQLPSAFFF